jgi:hypothetical protein
MDFRILFQDEYYRHDRALDKLRDKYLRQHQTVAKGTTFEYEGELCTVVGATVYIELEDCFSEIDPDTKIIYFLDIPQWRVPSQPYMKVRWNQKTLVGFLNGELKDHQISPNL